MRKRDLDRYRRLLTEQLEKLVGNADRTLKEDMALDSNDLPDEVDLASAEYNQSFTFRLRDRERFLLTKVQQALRKIEEGKFSSFVFPGQKAERPLSTDAFLRLLERMEHPDITSHGFRSAFRDWASEETNFARETAEAALHLAARQGADLRTAAFLNEAPARAGRRRLEALGIRVHVLG